MVCCCGSTFFIYIFPFLTWLVCLHKMQCSQQHDAVSRSPLSTNIAIPQSYHNPPEESEAMGGGGGSPYSQAPPQLESASAVGYNAQFSDNPPFVMSRPPTYPLSQDDVEESNFSPQENVSFIASYDASVSFFLACSSDMIAKPSKVLVPQSITITPIRRSADRLNYIMDVILTLLIVNLSVERSIDSSRVATAIISVNHGVLLSQALGRITIRRTRAFQRTPKSFPGSPFRCAMAPSTPYPAPHDLLASRAAFHLPLFSRPSEPPRYMARRLHHLPQILLPKTLRKVAQWFYPLITHPTRIQ